MGRRPNPVIATHFIRGQKHGQSTNRYAQTCSHCGQHFPTGRPETLFAHLASCPNLSRSERSEVVIQMYPTAAVGHLGIGDAMTDDHQQSSTMLTPGPLDVIRLNVLAGAAENAEDMPIDPQIAEDDTSSRVTSAPGQPLPFYDTQFGGSYHTGASNNAWPFHFSNIINPPSPFQDVSNAEAVGSPFSAVTSPSLQQWSFAPIITPPATYMSHPSHHNAVSFADQDGNEFEADGDDSTVPTATAPVNPKARKSREPYKESKRARVAEMRQIGVCIRCSRLRKTCEPARPCKACSQTASKTWVGGCTTLNRGQEFSIWYDNHFSRIFEMQVLANGESFIESQEYDGHVELAYFGDDGPRVSLNLVKFRPRAEIVADDGMSDGVPPGSFIIHKNEDISGKLLDFVVENQERIIEAIDIPALYSTVRTAQGLSTAQDVAESHQTWGTGKQSDGKLKIIFEFWLLISLLTLEQFSPTMAVIDRHGQKVDEALLGQSLIDITAQIDTTIEAAVQQNKDELRRVDANILNQSYKHLFNLVIDVFLILDIVENYCCFMKRHGCPFTSEDTMMEQAQTLAYKYTYCIHNIQMIPRLVLDSGDNTLTGASGDARVDHELQRLWIKDLNLSENDLDGYMNGWGDEEWLVPTGRLWARLFRGLSRE